jgi:hypothetical protein
VEVTDLGFETRQRMTAALKRGEPLHLRLMKPIRRGVRASRNCRLDEIVPLCASVEFSDDDVGFAASEWSAPSGAQRRGPSVTVVIPTRGDSPPAVDAFLAQDVNVRVLILSNGDGPDALAGADVVRVNWRGHGATRQAAIAQVNTPFVFFTVDDAIPLGTGFLRTLVSALEGGNWDAVTARQIPWPDADAVTATRLRRWTPPGRQVVACSAVDHVATLYRTDTLRSFPLPSVPIAEDAWWSIGRRVGYVPNAPSVALPSAESACALLSEPRHSRPAQRYGTCANGAFTGCGPSRPAQRLATSVGERSAGAAQSGRGADWAMARRCPGAVIRSVSDTGK